MKQSLIKFIVFSLILICTGKILSDETQLKKDEETLNTCLCGKKYLVSIENKNTLLITNMETLKIKRKNFDQEITNIDACAAFPFVNVKILQDYVNYTETKDLIYDIDTDQTYQGCDISPKDKRWSDDGQITFFSTIYTFILVETKNLRDYFEERDKTLVIAEIKGYPEGSISQVAWLGCYLIYRTACCDYFSWGMYDISNRKNYFVATCSDLEDVRFIWPCFFENTTQNKVMALLMRAIEKDMLKEISNDFTTEVTRIVREKMRPEDFNANIVMENSVLFFECSREEIESLEILERNKMKETRRKFSNTILKLTDKLLEHNLRLSSSSAEQFKFVYSNKEKIYFNRRKEGITFGMALFGKGKKPKIISGALTEKEILNEIEKYFKINL